MTDTATLTAGTVTAEHAIVATRLGDLTIVRAGDRLTGRKSEPAGETGDVPRARQLEQGERVAVTLLDDLVANGGIQRTGHVGQQQRAGIAVAETADGQLGQPGEDVIADPRPRGAHDRDPLGEQTAAHEPQNLRRRLIQPLPVVDNAD